MRLRITIVTLIALLLSACGGTIDTSPASSPPEDDETVEVSADEATGADGAEGPEEEVDAPDAPDEAVGESGDGSAHIDTVACPSPPVVPSLTPLAGASDFPAEGSGLPAGTYGSTMLGVAFAVDVPDGFEDAGAFGENIGLFGRWDPAFDAGAFVAIGRPEGYVSRFRTQEQVALGQPRRIVDLSTWLTETGVDVLADEPITVADREARRVRFLAVEDLIPDDDFDDLPVTPDVGAQPGPFEHMIVEIPLETGAPLIVYAAGPGNEFPETAATLVASMSIGDVGERPSVVFAETPWDAGNVFRPEPVGACVIPAVAFDGVTFELSQPARIQGTGDELWIFETGGRHVGFTEPYVNVVRPDTTALGGTAGPPLPGDIVATVEDALAELEAEGYELEPLGDVGTLLGAPAVGYDFTVERDDVWLWFPRSHAASTGLGFASDEGRWQGTMHLAEVGDGVVIVSAGGEIGTADVDLVRPLFDDIVASLSSAD